MTGDMVPADWVREKVEFLRELGEKCADHGIGAGLESAALVLETGLSSLANASRIGYRCKKCNGPAPVGIGYTDYRPGAVEASAGLTSCACGWSQTAGATA